jgi:hypothetical protein
LSVIPFYFKVAALDFGVKVDAGELEATDYRPDAVVKLTFQNHPRLRLDPEALDAIPPMVGDVGALRRKAGHGLTLGDRHSKTSCVPDRGSKSS